MAILDPYIRRCKLLRVVDGDTVWLTIDMGYRLYSDHSVRLLGIDAPEIYRGSPEEKKLGQAAKDYVIQWFASNMKFDEKYPFLIKSHKADSFGRYLGEIWNFSGTRCLSVDLIEAGHAFPDETYHMINKEAY